MAAIALTGLFSLVSMCFRPQSAARSVRYGLVAIAIMVVGSASAEAATRTWDGGGTNGNWTTVANWATNVAPVANERLVFDGTVRQTSTNTFAANTQFDSITFLWGGFTISGNDTKLSAALPAAAGAEITSAGNNTISMKISKGSGGSGMTIDTVSGTLTMTAALNGTLTSSGTFTKTGAGTLSLTADNGSMTGHVAVNQGVVMAAGFQRLGALTAGRQVTVASGATLTFTGNDTFGNWDAFPVVGLTVNGTVNSNGPYVNKLGAVTLNGGTLTGTAGYTGPSQFSQFPTAYIFTGSSQVTVGGSTASTISVAGPTNPRVALEGVVTFNVADATGDAGADLTLNAIVSNHPDTTKAAGGITKSGAGTLVLSGSNTFTAGTNVNAGIVSLGHAQALGSSGTISFGGGTLQYSASNTADYSGRFSAAAGQAYNLDTNGQNVTLATGLTSSGGSLTKSGAGTLTLTGSNSFAGATTAAAGHLLVNGRLSSGTTTVAATALLGGSGTISGAVIVGHSGTLSPGSSAGLLTVGSLLLTGSSSTRMEIVGSGTTAGAAGTGYDQLLVTSANGITFGGVLELDFGNRSSLFAEGTIFQLFSFSGTASGDFTTIRTIDGSGSYANLTFSPSPDVPGEWTTGVIAGSGGQSLVFSENTGRLVALPEPSAVVMAAVGAGVAGWRAVSRRRGNGRKA